MKVLFVLFLSFISLSPIYSQSTKNIERPNIIFLVIEDTSPYLLPAYGNQSIKTPNIDYLADNGVVFTNSFSNGPQCSPARSSLISGCYATTYGNDWHRNGHIVPQEYFFPQFLRKAGYYCLNAGKTDYNVTKQVQKDYYNIVWDEMSGYSKGDKKNVSYNDSARGDKPFFAQFNNMTTHMSRMTTVSVNNRKPSRIAPEDVILPPHVPDLPEVRSDYALHLEGVEDADKWVGLFLDDLRKRDLIDNTIIFFFSDHGGCLPRGKAFPYETAFKTALVISAPEKWKHLLPAQTGEKSARLVEFVDFGPTLLSIAGVKAPEHMQGKAFMGEFEKKEKEYAYCFRTNTGIHFDPSRSVLDGDYQYIKYYTPYKVHALKQSFQWGMPAQIAWDSLYHHNACLPQHKQYFESKPQEMLFDSKRDPFGMNNLANDPAYSVILRNLRKQAKEHISQTKDLGFFPKEIRDDFVKRGISLYEWVRQTNYPLNDLHTLVEKAALGVESDTPFFINYLSHERPEFRFWAAAGLTNMAHLGHLKSVPSELSKASNDSINCVAATATEAMVLAGDIENGMAQLIRLAKNGNELALSSMEELGVLALPYIDDLKFIAENGKGTEIKFLARGILINMNQMPMSKLFNQKQINKFIRGHNDRVINWAPTKP